MLGCSLVQPHSFWGLSVTSVIINITGTAIFTCQAQSNHLETEACSSINEHFGGQRSREGKLVGCIYFSLNKWNVNNGDEKPDVHKHPGHWGAEMVGCGGGMVYLWLRKKTPWDTEGQRMSNHFGDFLELSFISIVFIHHGSIYFLAGSNDAVLSKDMEYPFSSQSKENSHASVHMWFVGFMVKDSTAGIVSKSSLKIVFCAQDIYEDCWG